MQSRLPRTFTWKLGAAVVSGLFCVGYIVNFVFSNGNNRPAVFYAWLFFLAGFLLYKWHRRSLIVKPEFDSAKKNEADQEEEFREWYQAKYEKK